MDLDRAEVVDMSLSTRDVKVACTTLYRNIVPHGLTPSFFRRYTSGTDT